VVENDADELGGGGGFDRDAVEVDREWGVVLGVLAQRDKVQELELGEVKLEPYPFCAWTRHLFHVGLYLHDILGDGVRHFDSTDVVDVARILVVQELTKMRKRRALSGEPWGGPLGMGRSREWWS
jgi:hypothetical protein